jgi:hypothetical protein
MRVIARAFGCILAAGTGTALSADTTPEIRPFSGGQYMIYGGGLGDVYAPKTGDTKLYLELSGDAARRIFDSLGRASEKKMCADPDDVLRMKGDIACTRSKDGKHVCQLGFDLTTGKSANATIC